MANYKEKHKQFHKPYKNEHWELWIKMRKDKALLAEYRKENKAYWKENKMLRYPMMADMFDMPVSTLQNTEGPALGAAILAGVGAKLYPDIPTACRQLLKASEPVRPDAERHAQYEKFFDLYQKLYPALKDCYHELANIE